VLLVSEEHLVSKAGLGDIASRDHQECGEAMVIASGVARIAIAVVRRKFGGVVARPFGAAVVFEEAARALETGVIKRKLLMWALPELAI
jgi:hypothetical protein